MKYLLVVPSGLCERPCHELEGQTPLEAAQTPTLDRLARQGRLGRVTTCPQGLPVGPDVALLTLLGYDPRQEHTGRGALEALGLGHEVLAGDWVLRLSFLCVKKGMCDAVVPVRDAEAHALLNAFIAHFQSSLQLPGSVIRTGAHGRHLLVQPALSGVIHDWDALLTLSPYEVLGQAIAKHLPVGGDLGPIWAQVVRASESFFANHEINLTRIEMGEAPVTHVWPWGQGRLPGLRPLPEKWGLRAGLVAEPGLALGVAKAAGLATFVAQPDGSPAALALAAARALSENDLVVVHARLGHTQEEPGNLQAKVADIEAFDRDFLAPTLKRLEESGSPWRMLVAPDHGVLGVSGQPLGDPVPLLMAGHRVPHVVDARYGESQCAKSDLQIVRGEQLLEYFLKSGLNPERGGF